MLLEFARAGAKPLDLKQKPRSFLAEDRFKTENKTVVLRIYDGKTFPFADNTFDYAYSTSVLEHMSYPQEVITEIARTLVPGGKFYLSFPNRYAPKESHTGLWGISWMPRPLAQFFLRLLGQVLLKTGIYILLVILNLKMGEKGGIMNCV